MDTIVNNFLTVDLVLVFQVLVKSRLNILYDRSPAKVVFQREKRMGWEEQSADLSSLLTKSPKPGVSTTVKRRRTPFSSISIVWSFSEPHWARVTRMEDEPALMLSMATVLGFSALGGRGSFGW